MTSENLRAAGWTVATYGSVAINDALIKLVMLRMPQLQAIFVRGCVPTRDCGFMIQILVGILIIKIIFLIS